MDNNNNNNNNNNKEKQQQQQQKKKIEQLSPQQKAMMHVIRDKWINTCLNNSLPPVQESDIREVIDWIYGPEISNQKKNTHPRIIIFDSYIGMQIGYNLLLDNNNNNNNNNNKEGGRGDGREKQQKQQPRFVDDYLGLGSYCGWLAFYDYFETQLGISHPNFIKMRDKFLSKGVWTSCFFEDIVLICRMPTKVSKDAEGRLHSVEGPAIQWRDGSGQYFLHGVNFSTKLENHLGVAPDLWKKIVGGGSTKKITYSEILQIENQEQRYAALRVYGPERLFKELPNSKLIDVSKKRGHELYSADIAVVADGRNNDNNTDRILRGVKILKYTDTSTGRLYVDFVPSEIKTADEAMAWKFNISVQDYDYLELEA